MSDAPNHKLLLKHDQRGLKGGGHSDEETSGASCRSAQESDSVDAYQLRTKMGTYDSNALSYELSWFGRFGGGRVGSCPPPRPTSPASQIRSPRQTLHKQSNCITKYHTTQHHIKNGSPPADNPACGHSKQEGECAPAFRSCRPPLRQAIGRGTLHTSGACICGPCHGRGARYGEGRATSTKAAPLGVCGACCFGLPPLRTTPFSPPRLHHMFTEVKEVTLGKAAAPQTSEDGWIPICRPEDLPKGALVWLVLGCFGVIWGASRAVYWVDKWN